MDADDRLLFTRIFDKIDATDKKVNELCLTTAATKVKVDTHLIEQEKKGARKERAFYIVIAAMASVFSLFSFLRSEVN